MILADVSIKRPVFATIISVIIIVFGLYSLPELAVEKYPDIDFPVVSVWVTWPGADPASVEKKILEPLERVVNATAGLETLRSTAYPGAGLLVLKFKLEKKSDQVVQEVRDKVFSAFGELPLDVETPIIQKYDISGDPIINLTMSGANLDIGELSAIAENEIRPALQRVEGVARVELIGDRKREIHVLLDPALLSSFSASPDDVVNSIQMQNLDMPVGALKTGDYDFGLRMQKKISSSDELANLPLLLKNSQHLRLFDVAVIKDTIATERTAAFLDQSPTVLVSIFKQSGGNTIFIANQITETIARLNKDSQKGILLTIVDDNSNYIRGTIAALRLDLIFGALLAILVVFIFLRDFRATIISALALPTAVIGTFSFLKYMDFTLNMMTMLGLSLSIGILIDDAIVVIENIYRHISMGKDAKTAAKDATSEIGLAVLATTLTVCAVFIPVAFMEGIIGRFFFQFGLTVAFAVLISLFVAFTLTPMLASKWLKPGYEHNRNDFFDKILIKIETIYRRVLLVCLRNRWKTLLAGFSSFIFSLFLLTFIPVSFFAKEDEGSFSMQITLPENSNLEATKKQTLLLAELIKKYPGVENTVSAVAASGGGQINTARVTVNLSHKSDRNYTQAEIMDRIRHEVVPIFTDKGVELLVGGGGKRGGNIQMVLNSDSTNDLAEFSEQVVLFIKNNIKQATDVTTNKPKHTQEYNVNINLDLSRDIGLNPSLLASGTRTLFEGQNVGKLEDDTGRHEIVVKIAPEYKKSLQDVSRVTFSNDKLDQLSLGSVSNMESILAAESIERYNGQKEITVSANYSGKDLSSAVDKIQSYIKTNSPSSITMKLEGEADSMTRAIASMLKALLLAVLLIYLILCAQYERYLAPLVIMMALPLSLTGAFGALLLTNEAISIYTMIGIILLMGLVTKNGILLIDFTLKQMSLGKSIFDSLIDAGTTRLRPILMTTCAAGLGMLPIAFGHGDGGEVKASMGIAVMGGLFMSTLLTLVVVPCMFSVMEDFLVRIKRRRN